MNEKIVFRIECSFVKMLDGFRADYAKREDPSLVPTFTRFEREGVTARYVQPIYPALSFPSWTTIVTGYTS